MGKTWVLIRLSYVINTFEFIIIKRFFSIFKKIKNFF